jgi:hypothetical protein
MLRPSVLLLGLLAAACGRSTGGSTCGMMALAGATMLLDRFSTPQTTLSMPPLRAPEALPVRLAAGPAYRGLIGTRADSTWTVTVEGTLPDGVIPGFGVLVVGADGVYRGVMLYTGERIRGAPVLGSVTVGSLTLPLIGLQTDLAGMEEARCPFFPDSLGRP